MIAQDKAVTGTFRNRLEENFPIDRATGLCDRQGLRDRMHRLHDDHIVHQFNRLARPNGAAMGDRVTHAIEHRLNPAENVAASAHHDAERPVDRGLRRARDRRICEVYTFRLAFFCKLPGKADRAGAGIDQGFALGHQPNQSALTLRDGADLWLARQTHEDDVGTPGQIGERRRGLDTILGKPRQWLRAQIVRDHPLAAFPRQVPAHRLAHYPQADKSQNMPIRFHHVLLLRTKHITNRRCLDTAMLDQRACKEIQLNEARLPASHGDLPAC